MISISWDGFLYIKWNMYRLEVKEGAGIKKQYQNHSNFFFVKFNGEVQFPKTNNYPYYSNSLIKLIFLVSCNSCNNFAGITPLLSGLSISFAGHSVASTQSSWLSIVLFSHWINMLLEDLAPDLRLILRYDIKFLLYWLVREVSSCCWGYKKLDLEFSHSCAWVCFLFKLVIGHMYIV